MLTLFDSWFDKFILFDLIFDIFTFLDSLFDGCNKLFIWNEFLLLGLRDENIDILINHICNFFNDILRINNQIQFLWYYQKLLVKYK